MSIGIDELKAKIVSGEATLLPADRAGQTVMLSRLRVVLKGKALTFNEVQEACGFSKKSHSGALRYLEKKGFVKSFFVNGNKNMVWCLTEDLEKVKA